jgi:hypothetical protein
MTAPRPPRPTYASPTQAPAPQHVLVPAERLAERKGVVSILGSAKRAGSWTLPRRLRVVATLGSTELDLRQATFSEGTTEIELFALFGSVQVTVPPGVRVECDVDTLLARAEAEGSSDATAAAPDAPVVRIRGSAVFASVEVRVRAVGEDGIFATVRRALRG